MTATATQTAERCDMTAVDYHANPANGSSMLEDFRESRRLYFRRHVAKTEPPKKATEVMQLGKLVHALLFQPAEYELLLAPPPPEKGPDGKPWLRRKGSLHEQAWNGYLATTEGKIIADSAKRQQVVGMVAALEQHEYAGKLLGLEGEAEVPIFWLDERTGIECKCMVDYLSAIPVDLKTTEDPSPESFARTAVALGYHRKRAHYRAGLAAYLGRRSPPLVHIAIGSKPPYLVSPYELDDLDRRGASLGETQRRFMLSQLAECLDTGDWREPCEKQVTVIRLPGWAFSQDDWIIS